MPSRESTSYLLLFSLVYLLLSLAIDSLQRLAWLRCYLQFWTQLWRTLHLSTPLDLWLERWNLNPKALVHQAAFNRSETNLPFWIRQAPISIPVRLPLINIATKVSCQTNIPNNFQGLFSSNLLLNWNLNLDLDPNQLSPSLTINLLLQLPLSGWSHNWAISSKGILENNKMEVVALERGRPSQQGRRVLRSSLNWGVMTQGNLMKGLTRLGTAELRADREWREVSASGIWQQSFFRRKQVCAYSSPLSCSLFLYLVSPFMYLDRDGRLVQKDHNCCSMWVIVGMLTENYTRAFLPLFRSRNWVLEYFNKKTVDFRK